jgi:hypothetical protein
MEYVVWLAERISSKPTLSPFRPFPTPFPFPTPLPPQMSLVLTWGARIPTLRIARMAGQFAKPRSKDTEVVNGVEIPAFRGDNVNSFDTSNRTPDPGRLVTGYFHSAATLNYARAVLASGLADLKAASHWDLGFVQVRRAREYELEGKWPRCPFRTPSRKHASLPLFPRPFTCRTKVTAGSTSRWWIGSSRRSTSCACAASLTRPPLGR